MLVQASRLATFLLAASLSPAVMRAQATGASVQIMTAPATGTVRGTVFDSLLRTPVANALVWFPGGNQTAITDKQGKFELTAVPAGPHSIGVAASSLDSLGLSNMSTSVDVRSGETSRATLATPSFKTMWRTLCAGVSPAGGDSGIVWGTIRDAATDTRLSGARAIFSWYDLHKGANKKLEFGEVYRSVHTDSTGTYYACGLPYDIIISSEAAGVRSASGTIEFSVGLRRLFRVDMLVSTDMVLAADAMPKTEAESLAVLRARGNASVRGVVRDESGKLQAGATVGIATVDSTVRTNDKGEFVLDSLPAGSHVLKARQIGYAPASMLVDLRPNHVTVATIEMPSASTLATFNVRASRIVGQDKRAFDDRRRKGFGYAREGSTFANRLDVASVLREFPSITVRYSPRGELSLTFPGNCAPTIYLDGMRSDLEVVTLYNPADFRAIEVFPREMTVPSQYSNANRCGVALFWSKWARW